MDLTIHPTELPGVLVVTSPAFADNRGWFKEVYHQRKYAAMGLDRNFVQDNISHSCRGTLRGLHYQLHQPQAKLVSVVQGEIFDVAVDIRPGSPHVGRWVGRLLTGQNHQQMFIPEGFAHGFCVVSETATVLYKCTDYYLPGDDHGVLWSDPALAIKWPQLSPVLSDKDNRQPLLSQIADSRLPRFIPTT